MSEKATLRLLVLHESELRKAGQLLDQLIAIEKRDHTDDEYSDAAVSALNACLIALHGVANTDNVLMLSAVDLTRRAEPDNQTEKEQ